MKPVKMEVTHTPAPWVYRRPLAEQMRGQAHSFEVNAKSNGVYKPYIADVRSMDAEGRDNSEANARLITAAPDLLAALEGLFEHCAMIHKHWGDGSNAQEADTAQQHARTAIAKAKGKA